MNRLIKDYKTLSYFCYDAVELVTEEQVGFFWLEPAEGETTIVIVTVRRSDGCRTEEQVVGVGREDCRTRPVVALITDVVDAAVA